MILYLSKNHIYVEQIKTKLTMIFVSGLQVHDTCNSEELTQKHLYHIISTTREAASVLRLKTPTGPPLLGMIGIGEPATLTETTGALHAFNIPLISVTPHPTGPSYSNVLTTAPDMAGQARVRFQNLLNKHQEKNMTASLIPNKVHLGPSFLFLAFYLT